MSSTNRIIIPVVGSKQKLQEQNVFKHANSVLTPQKDEQQQASIAWKKSQSAFKKFKQKKDRKQKKEEASEEQVKEEEPPKEDIFYKIVQKRGKFSLTWRYQMMLWNPLFTDFIKAPQNKYYDPNEAPLFVSDEKYQPVQYPKLESRPCSQMELIGGSMADLSGKKEQSEVMEDEYPLVSAIQPMSDDPFIIVRKNTSKKSSKSLKSKLIRKQNKFQKLRSRQSLFQNSQLSIDKMQKRQSVQNNPYMQNNQQKLLKIKKQIMTLEQLVQTANQKIQQQIVKKTKTKEQSQQNRPQKQDEERIDPD